MNAKSRTQKHKQINLYKEVRNLILSSAGLTGADQVRLAKLSSREQVDRAIEMVKFDLGFPPVANCDCDMSDSDLYEEVKRLGFSPRGLTSDDQNRLAKRTSERRLKQVIDRIKQELGGAVQVRRVN